MTKQEKKSPAYTDLDQMPFGKHRGVLIQDVPAHYFNWLKEQGCSDIKVANYIHNSWDAIKQELEGKE